MSNYVDYLEESTNVVKSKDKLAKLILILTGIGIWAISLIVFWFFMSGSDAFAYAFMFLWVLLPTTIFVVSLLIGKNNYWGKWKWFVCLDCGIMYMLAEYATFSAANMAAFNKINMPSFEMIPVGAVISGVGLGIGTLIRCLKRKDN